MEPILGRADVALVAVHEVEPVALAREAALDPVDRLDVLAAVACLELHLPVERLHRGQSRGHCRRQQHVRAFVAGDPQAGGAVGARAAAPRDEERGGENEAEAGATAHASAFDRTAPGAKARTRPRCLPTQAAPFGAGRVRPSTRSDMPGTVVRAPESYSANTR